VLSILIGTPMALGRLRDRCRIRRPPCCRRYRLLSSPGYSYFLVFWGGRCNMGAARSICPAGDDIFLLVAQERGSGPLPIPVEPYLALFAGAGFSFPSVVPHRRAEGSIKEADGATGKRSRVPPTEGTRWSTPARCEMGAAAPQIAHAIIRPGRLRR
jgi:hypothetical protein